MKRKAYSLSFAVIPRALTLLILLACPIINPTSRSQSRSVSDSAAGLIAGGRFDSAILILEAALKGQGDSVRFHRLLGQAYHAKQDLPKAIESYRRAAEIEGCDTCHSDYDTLGTIFLEKKDFEAALEYGEKASKRHSAAARRVLAAAHIQRGDKYEETGGCEKAHNEYQQSLDLIEDTLAYQRILACYALVNQSKELLELSARLLDKFPDFYAPRGHLCAAYYKAGQILESRGDLKGAIGWFEKAISMDARRAAELAVEIGKCYELLNDTNQAIQYYSNALPDTMSSSDAAIAISKIYIQRDQFKIATTALQRSLKIFPACAECWTNLADLYLKLGERKECIECDKIAAKLGDVSAQNRLRNSFIPYDSVDFSVLPWMDANPFAQSWWREWIRQDHLSAPDFVPLEKLPVPVKIVQPDYPELARRTGVEGEVQVKCLLDKHGRVVKVVLLKADPEIFAVPAINAAYQWEFSPPILKGTPVVCWVSVPFRFKLNK